MSAYSGLTVLLVEDNDFYREEVKNILIEEFPSTSVFEASDGQSALSTFGEFKPHIVFMDIGLPGENGLSLTRKIKALAEETLVIMLTSYDGLEYREAAMQSGADHFLVKGTASAGDITEPVKSFTGNGSAPKG
jgi:DNA-binding NarL/FixJ family response regulator